MKKIIIILSLALSGLSAKAQQELMTSQYMFNRILLNPGYTGSHDFINATMMYRQQWVNFPGAPKTGILAVDGPLKKNMGLGLILLNDRIGATEQTDIYANYSYQLKFKKGSLAFGLKGGVSNYIFKSHDLTTWDAQDNVLNSRSSVWITKFGFGAYYSTEKWYAGLSIPTLVAYDPRGDFGIDVNNATFLKRHYYVNAGYAIKASEDFEVIPSFLVKYLPTAPLQADFNTNVWYKKQFMLGASYRTGDAATVLAQYRSPKHFNVGYSYDFTISKLRKYSYGSHEIVLGYEFGHKEKKTTKTYNSRF